LSWSVGWLDVWAVLALVGFAVALTAEVIVLVRRPDKDWYAGRVVAESAKTLAWRFAVGAAPFPVELPDEDARAVLRQRFAEIVAQGGGKLLLDIEEVEVTPWMTRLRRSSFTVRRKTYVDGRTRRQHHWYLDRARLNEQRALRWQVTMIAAEVLAMFLAAGRALGRWDIDWSGVLAAGVAAGAAWIGVKQYSPLSAAYATAAAELALQAEQLAQCAEEDWSRSVADGEEAISREHTMWLASRSGNNV
jgi:hypothetical protein